MSYKVSEHQIKRLRKEIEAVTDISSWKSFCHEYIGKLLLNEWNLLEDDLGLNFIEVLENEASDFFERPLLWSDMVHIMGEYGLRGPDAMILNFFEKSKIPLLITGDKDFEITVVDDSQSKTKKAVYIL